MFYPICRYLFVGNSNICTYLLHHLYSTGIDIGRDCTAQLFIFCLQFIHLHESQDPLDLDSVDSGSGGGCSLWRVGCFSQSSEDLRGDKI
jgi:hypothetical protein